MVLNGAQEDGKIYRLENNRDILECLSTEL